MEYNAATEALCSDAEPLLMDGRTGRPASQTATLLTDTGWRIPLTNSKHKRLSIGIYIE